ncbi:MAG: hypothetical protein DRQ59_01650 [Gammaproteobacteria bacterium]|nr:MAG: hypothetical protein DRQ59_01650 [Gammaproteobacteria bacterium]
MIDTRFSFILLRMPLTEDNITSRYSISAYSPDGIVVNNQNYRQSLVLSAQTINSPWPVRSISELDESSLQIVLDMNPDVVLLGTGERQEFPEARIFALLGQQGIGLEVMNNGALCRTFNILVAEDRAVVAAIMLAG